MRISKVLLEAVEIDNIKRRADWNAIRAEYISGVSIRKLAEKYGVNKSTIGEKCAAEHWTDSRTKAADKARAKAVQKTAEAAANNAVKLERARGLAIDKVIKALERMPDGSGSHVRRQLTDEKTGLPIVMDYDLGVLVQALAKLTEETERNEGAEDRTVVIVDV